VHAHVKLAGTHLAMLDDRSVPVLFIGYEPGSKVYTCCAGASRLVVRIYVDDH
jgi:hypothetical protein